MQFLVCSLKYDIRAEKRLGSAEGCRRSGPLPTSIAAGYRERGRPADALRVIRKARTYGTSDHLLNVLRAIEADIAKA